ncbi:hypothetical protein BOTBODRAFT_602524 [Botryobasidium botryosum FD-172 SS1]|uniref:Uncharacterized protein n=1 Tax=Botryobasidium botryosum (strain FD-172 SS1) TaxID=930990 RepID=A0A067MRG8_BOTB1|nr:hypothetical protein BOTBODRAFT_602524 [Botryobasidium botryosum FD-172 SS1]
MTATSIYLYTALCILGVGGQEVYVYHYAALNHHHSSLHSDRTGRRCAMVILASKVTRTGCLEDLFGRSARGLHSHHLKARNCGRIGCLRGTRGIYEDEMMLVVERTKSTSTDSCANPRSHRPKRGTT